MKTKTVTMKATLAKGDVADAYPVAMLVGDKSFFLGEDIFFPIDELSIGSPSMEGQPLNLDHSHAVEDEVGFVRGAHMDGATLRGEAVLTPGTAKYATAKAFIENRLAAGKPPEVSVGVYLEIHEEKMKDGSTRLVARNLAFDHLALVSRGACSPEAGCGVGMCRHGKGVLESPGDIKMANDPKLEAEPQEQAAPEAQPTPETQPAPETQAAPDAQPDEKTPDAQPEAQAEAQPDAAPEKAEEPACSCGAMDSLASAREALAEMTTIARDSLKPRAAELGLDVADDECVKTLKQRIADAEKVHAKLLANVAQHARTGGARRHTASAPPAKTEAQKTDDEAVRLLKAGGYRPRFR